MKPKFRIQDGGFCGIPYEENTACSKQILAPPHVVLSKEEHEERARRLKANQQPWKREYFPAPPCVLAIKEQEDGA